MTKHFEATLPTTEFNFDRSRFADLQGAVDVIDEFRQIDPLRSLRPTNSAAWMRERGVDVNALAQRIGEVTEMQRDVRPENRAYIDLFDIEDLIRSGLDVRRLNFALRSQMPTATLATALAHVEPLGYRCKVARRAHHDDPMGWDDGYGYVPQASAGLACAS